VRWIVENSTPKFEGFPMSQRVTESLPQIFNFQYPIWNDGYRRILEKKIIMHYFNKEIGFETVALWKFYLEERLNLIMPYYNQLYTTIAKEYDWMNNYSMSEDYDKEGSNTNNTNSEANGSNKYEDSNDSNTKTDTHSDTSEKGNSNLTESDTNKLLKSDLPQANFAGKDYGTNLDEGEGTRENVANTHTTFVGDTTVNSTTTSSSNSTNDTTNNAKIDSIGSDTEKYKRSTKGHNVSLTQLNLEYRNSLINIDKMIIEELYDLFMLIY
jgi:hypothetical protein